MPPDEEVVEAPSVTEEDKPTAVEDAPADAGQADETQEESFIDSFNLDDVPAEARPHVEALQKQWQGNYTQKRQADREEVEEARREAEQYGAIVDGIRDPQTRQQYLSFLGLTQEELLQMFGLEMADTIEEEDGIEDDEFRDPRVDALLAERQQAEAAQAEEQQLIGEANYIDQELQRIEDKAGVEFDDEEAELLTTRARAHPDKLGRPDVMGAYKFFNGILDRRQKGWIESRKDPTPAGATGGVPASKTVDPSTREGRLQLGREAAEGASISQ